MTMKKQQKIEPGFLKDDLRSALEVRHFTRRTKETYIYWITRYQTFLKSHRRLGYFTFKTKSRSFPLRLGSEWSRGYSN